MAPIRFSDEQSEIIRYATKTDYNVVVDAVAGSGKTTSIVGIAQADPSKHVVALTYNAHLRSETQNRFDDLNVSNAQIYTVHSFVYRHYNNEGYTDAIIDDTIKQNLPIRKPPKVDILILDEFQDFNWLMVELVVKFIRDLQKPIKLVVLGDKFQTIYGELHGSDNRFLIYANHIFERFGKWRRLALQTSYRLPDKVARFMNDAVLKSQLFKTVKTSDIKPTYLITRPWNKNLPTFILDKIKEGGYSADDIFILCPSIRSDRQPVYMLTNYLSQNGYAIYASTDLENKSSAEELTGKICVNTYHISKGRERSLTIVYNFDSSYFKWYAKGAQKSMVSNTQYVALTRCKDELIVIHDCKEDYLNYLDTDDLEELCDVEVLDDMYIDDTEYRPGVYLSVTQLLAYTTWETEKMARDYYTCKKEGANQGITLPNTVDQMFQGKKIVENVAGLNGMIMSLIYEHHLTGDVAVVRQLKGRLEQSVRWEQTNGEVSDPNEAPKDALWLPQGKVREKLVKMSGTDLTFPSDFIFIALILEAESSGGAHRFRQLTDLNWISDDDRRRIIDCLSNVCSGKNCEFEVPFETKFQVRGKFIHGRVDIIDHENKTLIEVKYVDTFTECHIIQVLLYWYLASSNDSKYKEYSMLLVNVKSGSKYVIKPRLGRNVYMLLDYLVMKKYAPIPVMSDGDFISKAKALVDKYFQVESGSVQLNTR